MLRMVPLGSPINTWSRPTSCRRQCTGMDCSVLVCETERDTKVLCERCYGVSALPLAAVVAGGVRTALSLTPSEISRPRGLRRIQNQRLEQPCPPGGVPPYIHSNLPAFDLYVCACHNRVNLPLSTHSPLNWQRVVSASRVIKAPWAGGWQVRPAPHVRGVRSGS